MQFNLTPLLWDARPRGVLCNSVKAGKFHALCVLMPTFDTIYSALPTESAMTAPRAPSGLSPRTVKSRTVWCSISEFNCAPNNITMEEIHIHIIMPMAAPSEP